MSYKSYTDHRTNAASNVAYVHSVAPVASIGEAVYTAAESAIQAACRVYWSARVDARASRSIRTLSALEDHTLRDIGIRRSEIHNIARKMAENPGMEYRVIRQ